MARFKIYFDLKGHGNGHFETEVDKTLDQISAMIGDGARLHAFWVSEEFSIPLKSIVKVDLLK